MDILSIDIVAHTFYAGIDEVMTVLLGNDKNDFQLTKHTIHAIKSA